MTLDLLSNDACTSDDKSLSILPGTEALTLLSRRLLFLRASMEELRRYHGEEETSYQNFIKKLSKEEASLERQLHTLETRCARLTESLKNAIAPLNAALLWDELQRLCCTETGLELLELQTREEIYSMQKRMTCEACEGAYMDNTVSSTIPVLYHTWEPSRHEPCAGGNTHLAVQTHCLVDAHALGEAGTLSAASFPNVLLPTTRTPSPELRHLMLALSDPDCKPHKLGKLLNRFAATSPHVLLQVDEEGNTPLHAACAATTNSVALVKILLRAGADICVRNIAGLTPFHVASLNVSDRDAALKKCLLRAGCNVNERTTEGETAAHLCATDNRYFYSFRFLYSVGADMSAGAFFHGMWCTPVEVARASGSRASRISALLRVR